MKFIDVIIGLATQPRTVGAMLDRGHQWVAPFVVVSAFALLSGLLSLSLVRPLVMEEIASAGIAKDISVGMRTWERFATVSAYLGPVVIALKWLFCSAVIYATCVVFGLQVRFLIVLNIVGYCALFLLLQDMVVFGSTWIGIQSGTVKSLGDLATPMGLDVFVQSKSVMLGAVLAYFTPLQVWSILASGLAISGVARARAVLGLAVLVPLTMMQVTMVAAFQLMSKVG